MKQETIICDIAYRVLLPVHSDINLQFCSEIPSLVDFNFSSQRGIG